LPTEWSLILTYSWRGHEFETEIPPDPVDPAVAILTDALQRAYRGLVEAARDLPEAIRAELPDLKPLHDAARDACAVNRADKRACWQQFVVAVRAWRYYLVPDEPDQAAETWLTRLVTPEDGSPAAATAAFLCFCWLVGTVPATDDPELVDLPGLPFIPFPYQELVAARALWLMLDRPDGAKDLGILKSRQIGLTTLFVHLFVWLWRLRRVFLGLGSRAESEVDNNAGSRNPHTLMGRCETIVTNLPDCLVPPGVDLADKTTRQMLQWINPHNGARIDGEAAGINFTRDRTYGVLLVDEWAKWQNPESVIAASGPNVRLLRVLLTTPDPDTPAVEAFFKRISAAWSYRYVEIEWWEHPERDERWEQAQRTELGDKLFAHEHELSFQAEAERVIYSEWRNVRIGAFAFESDWEVIGGIDYGKRDGTGIIVAQVNPATDWLRILATHFSAGQTIDFYKPLMGALIASGVFTYSQEELEFIDLVQLWQRRSGGIAWFGDPAGEQITQIKDESVADSLRRSGIYVRSNEKIRSHEERQSACRQLLRTCEVNLPLCGALDYAMRRYRWPKLNANVAATPRRAPIHRESHLPTALEYIAVNKPLWAGGRMPVLPVRRHAASWEARR